jgi:cytochrome c oxidase subunit 2
MRGANEEDIYGRQMAPMAAILANDAMIRNVADYIASLPSDPAETTIIGNVENGRRLFMTCGSCHGRKGEGIWSVFAPRLSGKDDWYLARQLKHFKDGVRGSHPLDLPGRQMALLSITLKDDQAINDVIAYINTLPTVE